MISKTYTIRLCPLCRKQLYYEGDFGWEQCYDHHDYPPIDGVEISFRADVFDAELLDEVFNPLKPELEVKKVDYLRNKARQAEFRLADSMMSPKERLMTQARVREKRGAFWSSFTDSYEAAIRAELNRTTFLMFDEPDDRPQLWVEDDA